MASIAIPAGVELTLTLAEKILQRFGLKTADIGDRIKRGGDKRQRLQQIETLAHLTAMHTAALLQAAEGKPPEVSSALKDTAIDMLTQTLATCLSVADLDGSSQQNGNPV